MAEKSKGWLGKVNLSEGKLVTDTRFSLRTTSSTGGAEVRAPTRKMKKTKEFKGKKI